MDNRKLAEKILQRRSETYNDGERAFLIRAISSELAASPDALHREYLIRSLTERENLLAHLGAARAFEP